MQKKVRPCLRTSTTANVERVQIHDYGAILAPIDKILVQFEMLNAYLIILRAGAHTLTIRMVLARYRYRQGDLLIGK